MKQKDTTKKDSNGSAKKVILRECNTAQMRDALNAPKDHQRFLFYSRRIENAMISDAYQDDEKICFGCASLIPKMGANGGLYYVSKDKRGFTYNKETKKCKIWFGKIGRDLPCNDMELFFNYLNLDWVTKKTENFGNNLYAFSTFLVFVMETLTGGRLAKIISGKITSQMGYISDFNKYSLRGVDVSDGMLYKLTTMKREENNPQGLNYRNRLELLKVSTNPNNVISKMIKNEFKVEPYWLLDDLIRQALILGEKFNPLLSNNRLNSLHHKWTKLIMKKEIMVLGEDVPIIYKRRDLIESAKDFKLLDSKHKIFEEGYSMNHCVYNSYYDYAREHSVFLFHHTPSNSTIMVKKKVWPNRIDNFEVTQQYGKYNSAVDPEIKEECSKILTEDVRFVSFFQKNHKSAMKSEDVPFQF